MNLISEAIEFTYSEKDKSFMRKVLRGTAPKYITITDNILRAKRGRMNESIDLSVSNPAEIAAFFSKVISKRKKSWLQKEPELPSHTTLNKVKAGSTFNSLIFNFTHKEKERLSCTELDRERLESLIHISISNGSINTSDIDVINSEIVDIPHLHSNSAFNFSTPSK